MKRIFSIQMTLGVLSLVLTAALWQYPIVLTVLLACMGAVYVWKSKARHPYAMYIGVAAVGSLAEFVAMYFGAWAYTLPQISLLPLWLPFLWGNAALFILAMDKSSNE